MYGEHAQRYRRLAEPGLRVPASALAHAHDRATGHGPGWRQTDGDTITTGPASVWTEAPH